MKSFKHAFAGIWHCIRYERNFRIHMAAGAYVLFFARFYEFSRTEYAVLILTISAVLAAELFNTSVERIVNLQIRTHHLLAKEAKDIAAGAVLVVSIASVAVGIFLFGRAENLKEIARMFTRPLNGVSLTVTLIFSIIFIRGNNKIDKK